MSNPIISQKIKQLRIDRGLTQKDVYEKMGVSQSTFSSWELGKSEPSALAFLKLCRIYGVSDILLEFTGDSLNNDISKGEYSLIKKYRLLNEDDKKKIDTHMDDLLQAAENKKRLADAIKEADARMTSGFTLVAAGGDPQIGVTAPSEDKLLAAIKEAEEIKKRK